MATGVIHSIDGVAPKINLSQCEIDYMQLEMDSHRNANGNLIRNIINEKRKLLVEVPPMRYSKLKQFISQIKYDNISIAYHDLSTDTMRTGLFYRPDIKLSIYMDLGNNDYMMNAFQINFIEY